MGQSQNAISKTVFRSKGHWPLIAVRNLWAFLVSIHSKGSPFQGHLNINNYSLCPLYHSQSKNTMRQVAYVFALTAC